MTRRDTFVIIILSIITFVAVADNNVISPLLPDIARDLKLEIDVAGLSVSTYALAAGLAALVFGPLSDRYGRRLFLSLGIVVFAVAAGLCGSARSGHAFLAYRAFTGAGAGLISLSAISYAGDYFSYERRGAAMGLMLSGYFLAMVLGVPGATFVAESAGWRTVYAVFALLALVSLVCVGPFLPPIVRKYNPVDPAGSVSSVATYLRFLATKQTASILVCALLFSASLIGFVTFLGDWLKTQHALSTSQVGKLFFVGGLAAVIGSPVAGRLSDVAGKKKSLAASTAVMGLCFLVLPKFDESLWPVYLLFFVGYLCAAVRQAPYHALTTEVVEPARRGAMVASRNCVSQIGVALGAALGGHIYHHYSYMWLGLFAAAVAGVSALVVVFGLDEPAQQN